MHHAALSGRYDTIIIGGGQAGLAIGHELARRGLSFVILDAGERIGDSWRKRWDSLRLFTPAPYDSLPGMSFPGPKHAYPTKDELADYLETYAVTFDLPVRAGVKVDAVLKKEDGFIVIAGELRVESHNVVVATGAFHAPRVPQFAGELDPSILQLHSCDYRRPSQLRRGGVLVVGAGNSGAEIALEASRRHPTWLSGRDTGQEPTRAGTSAGPAADTDHLVHGVSCAERPQSHRPEGQGPFPRPSSGNSPRPGSPKRHRRGWDREGAEDRWGAGRIPDSRGRKSPRCERTSSGPPASSPTSHGSTFPCSRRTATRCTSGAWCSHSQASTSWACCFSTR